MRNISQLGILILALCFIVGCGETMRGVGKDVNRIGYGVKTIFVSPK